MHRCNTHAQRRIPGGKIIKRLNGLQRKQKLFGEEPNNMFESTLNQSADQSKGRKIKTVKWEEEEDD